MVFLQFHILYLFDVMRYPHTVRVRPGADSQAELYASQFTLCKVFGTLRMNYVKLV
jgi:hypothetical protein